MAELNERQLILLNNFIYLQGVANKDGISLGKMIEFLLEDNEFDLSRNLNKIGTEDEYPCKMSKEEWLAILNAIKNDPQLTALKIKNGVTGVMYDKNGEVVRDIHGKQIEAGMRVAAFVDPEKNATVVFRGTGGDYEWHDNGQGGYLTETEQQQAALKYINRLPYNNITVTGHSKGGNKTQYVTLLSDKVDRGLSFDGQGFSQEFIDKYKDQIEANAHKIVSISAEEDFVNCILNPIAGTIRYIDTEKQAEFAYNHKPNIVLDENGQLRQETQQGGIPRFINKFTIYINANLEDPYRAYAFDGALALMESGEEGFEREGPFQRASGIIMLVSKLDDYSFEQISDRYGEEAELVSTFVMAGFSPFLFMDDFIASVKENLENAFNYIMESVKQFGDRIVDKLHAAAVSIAKVGIRIGQAANSFAESVKEGWDNFKSRMLGVSVKIKNKAEDAVQAVTNFKDKLVLSTTAFFHSVKEGTKRLIDVHNNMWDKAVDKAVISAKDIVDQAKSEIAQKYAGFIVGMDLMRKASNLLIDGVSAPKKSFIPRVAAGYASQKASSIAIDLNRLADMQAKLTDMENEFESSSWQMSGQVQTVIAGVSRAYNESNVQRQIHNVQRACDEVKQHNNRVRDELSRKTRTLKYTQEHYLTIEKLISKTISSNIPKMI